MLSPITTLAKWLYVRWPLLQNHFALFSKELGSLPWKKKRERHPPLMTQGTSLSCCLATHFQSSDARCYTSLQVAVTHSQEMVSMFRALVRTCWLTCCVSCQAHSVPLTFLAGHHQHEPIHWFRRRLTSHQYPSALITIQAFTSHYPAVCRRRFWASPMGSSLQVIQ